MSAHNDAYVQAAIHGERARLAAATPGSRNTPCFVVLRRWPASIFAREMFCGTFVPQPKPSVCGPENSIRPSKAR